MTFVELNLPNSKGDTGKTVKMTTNLMTHGERMQPNGVGKSKRRSILPRRLPDRLAAVKENYFVQALSQTTQSFCQETTLHGMKYVVMDIQELGSTYSRYKFFSFHLLNF